ncbi:inovirus Gp2 family protein [Pseudomonas sp. NPDC078416]|uniref:inovirus Gp2 family protein n=1 Tax=Pseudomonas sp. NPDC078416 TaxID=3390637 RepID=UPI003D056E72
MKDYRRLLVVRLELRFPKAMPAGEIPDNRVLDKFTQSLRSKVKYQRARAGRDGKRAHPTDVRLVWVREFGPVSKRPHYHLMIVVNRDAYRGLGNFNSDDDNLARCIQGAWASALKLNAEVYRGLVNFSRGGQYKIINGHGYRQVLEAMQYLSKEYSKVRDGARNIGYSLARKDLTTHGCSIQCHY